MDRVTAERIARNDATFRDANERIDDVATSMGLTARAVPFICECADTRCITVVRVPLDEYAYIRSNPRWFLNIPGHDRAAAGAAEVVEDHGDYVIVEKVGHAGEVAEQLAGEHETRVGTDDERA